MKRSNAWDIAFGGIFAALSIVIMSLGTLIPVATFVCPMICCLMGCVVLRLCGRKTAIAWYAAVAILSLLLSPDKEAALIFVAFGYYPPVKQHLDRYRLRIVVKLLYFNASILLVHQFALRLLGLTDVLLEYSQLGAIWTVILLAAGNATFFLLDLLMKRILYSERKG